ncbi:MAG: dynamin family protein [Ligilactobacillus animalis]|uniref:dynamin family protein n=1 Tax=Ligilactobacillus animalis TaxID=1605 RepID=UPI00242E2423|nr:dynamin family protein [Ligilactobacillus animalis]MCI5941517.1 dynamin family protein [Ligilactobacillus animalis]MDY2994122.1 dynamin family protein [Ligilactobacillus animalis]
MAKEIFIKYNPYRLQTEVTIDGSPVKQNSKFNVGEKRLQEWIDKLPEYVREEFNTRDVEIVFYGTKLDYEDLKEIADEANIKTKYLPAKEGVANKEAAIQAVFEKIQNGPIDELKSPDVIRAFKQAQSNDFEVSVVATMSSGKSTVINALLGQKLMPSYNQACTATITRIKDNDSNEYTAKVFDNDGNILEEIPRLTYEHMSNFNRDDISEIQVEGDIPFVDANDTNLVLVDTPGPNNARNKKHHATTFNALNDSPKTVVLYILNATQLATDDDSVLLSSVAANMESGGKRSHDRFIFVLNKLDAFNLKEESINDALNAAKEYLESKGIKNPNIYPASALTALNIQTILASEVVDDDDDEVYDAKGKVRKFNRNEELHFENYAPLQKSRQERIDLELKQAISNDDSKKQALIHSGIPSIEEAVSLYVEKYAKTAKIKNIVDTFENRLKSADTLAELQKQMASNKEEQEKLAKKIEFIEKNINDGNQAKKYEEKIEALNADKELEEGKNKIIKDAQKLIREKLNKVRDRGELSQLEAKAASETLSNEIMQIQGKVESELEKLINEMIQKNGQKLLAGYLERLSSLKEEKGISKDEIELDPVSLMLGEVSLNVENMISESSETKEVVVGTEYVKNTNKRWFKPWTWFEEDGWDRDIIEERDFVDGKKLSQLFLNASQKSLYSNGEIGVNQAKKQVEALKKAFKEKFVELDSVLKKKISEVKEYRMSSGEIKKELKEIENRQAWLNEVRKEIDNILDI